MRLRRLWKHAVVVLLLAVGCRGWLARRPTDGQALTAPEPPPAPSTSLEPSCPDANPLKNLYWGDLHAHTSYSLDAYVVGTRTDPKDAYLFARDRARVRIASASATGGPEVTMGRPLDFLAVTEHSEFFNVTRVCELDQSSANGASDATLCDALRDQGATRQRNAVYQLLLQLIRPNPAPPSICTPTEARGDACREGARTTWRRAQEATEAAYERCRFTSFHAFEWTSQRAGANLHRNIIFANDKVPSEPIDYINFPTPLGMWRALSHRCRSADGCDAITIPHNSNASSGDMWITEADPEATPFMARYQTLVEIFQHKGNSECLPDSPLADVGCGFEAVQGSGIATVFGLDSKSDSRTAPGYVRDGLARGLVHAQKNRSPNPLQMGFVGATDTHNSTPGNVAEASWPGHMGALDNTPARRLKDNASFNPGGITGIWAEQNTRESLFAALKRRETYATSGPRIAVRFYAAPGVQDDAEARALCDDPGFPAKLIAAQAAPMGAVLRTKSAPYLFVFAMKDETDLAQVDIVKLWSDEQASPRVELEVIPLGPEQVARSCVFWKDQRFDAARPSLYYARVLEAPTWRWSHHDCIADPAAMPEGCDPQKGRLDVKIQERAWSSPIFVEP